MSKYICKRRLIELSAIEAICPKCAQRKWSMTIDYKDCQRFNILPIEVEPQGIAGSITESGSVVLAKPTKPVKQKNKTIQKAKPRRSRK